MYSAINLDTIHSEAHKMHTINFMTIIKLHFGRTFSSNEELTMITENMCSDNDTSQDNMASQQKHMIITGS